MTVVILPPDLDAVVQAVARSNGEAAEQLVIATLRACFTPTAAPPLRSISSRLPESGPPAALASIPDTRADSHEPVSAPRDQGPTRAREPTADLDRLLDELAALPIEGTDTDCTSRVVIQRRGIRAAFAFDQHFRQFGIDAVLPLESDL